MSSRNPASGNLDEYLNFGPLISHQEMMRFEAGTSGWGVARRSCLTVCTRSADMLRNMNSECPEAFDELFKGIEAFKQHARSLLDIAEAASLRMQIASNADSD